MILQCIAISQVLPNLITLYHIVLLPLVPILLFNSPVNNEPSFLKLLHPPNQVFVLEVTPGIRILIRTVRERCVFLPVPAFVVVITVIFFVVDKLVKVIIAGLN